MTLREKIESICEDAGYGVISEVVAADRILALLPAWQPIEDAPKDGTAIQVTRLMSPWGWVRGWARWGDVHGAAGWIAHGFYDQPGDLGLGHPTHWMPLPEPPSK